MFIILSTGFMVDPSEISYGYYYEQPQYKDMSLVPESYKTVYILVFKDESRMDLSKEEGAEFLILLEKIGLEEFNV